MDQLNKTTERQGTAGEQPDTENATLVEMVLRKLAEAQAKDAAERCENL